MSRIENLRTNARRRKARRELTRAIDNAPSTNVRDELINIAQRGGLL